MGSTRPSVITPARAQAIVDKIRLEHGLGGAYQLDITDNADGTWTVADGRGQVASVEPMSERAWRTWFQQNYGDVIEDRRETSEA